MRRRPITAIFSPPPRQRTLCRAAADPRAHYVPPNRLSTGVQEAHEERLAVIGEGSDADGMFPQDPLSLASTRKSNLAGPVHVLDILSDLRDL